MIPTNISRPQDIVVIFAIFAIVIGTIGFGIASVTQEQDVDVDDSFFTNVYNNATSSEGLKGTADSVSEGLTGTEGVSQDTSEESILVRGFNSILSIGKTYKITASALNEGSTKWLGIDPFYWIIYTSVMLVSFGVVMYTWIRGR